MPNRPILSEIASYFHSLYVWCYIKIHKIDVVQIELTNSIATLKFLPKSVKLVTDFHSDLVPEFKMYNFSNYKINKCTKENIQSLHLSDITITVSKNLKNNLLYYGDIKDNYILPCNYSVEQFEASNRQKGLELKSKLGIPQDKIVLCYSGGLHLWQCFKETLYIMIGLYIKDPRYFICI